MALSGFIITPAMPAFARDERVGERGCPATEEDPLANRLQPRNGPHRGVLFENRSLDNVLVTSTTEDGKTFEV